MKITENEMLGLILGQCLPGDIRVGEGVAAYLVRKFEEQEQKMEAECANLRQAIDDVLAQRDALAAENAAMKSVVEPIANLAQYGEIVAEMSEALRPHEVDGFVSLFSRARHIKTPATDAYLNSVRAEGVEMLAEHHLQKAERYSAAGNVEGSNARIKMYNIAENFAGQLRSQEAK